MTVENLTISSGGYTITGSIGVWGILLGQVRSYPQLRAIAELFDKKFFEAGAGQGHGDELGLNESQAGDEILRIAFEDADPEAILKMEVGETLLQNFGVAAFDFDDVGADIAKEIIETAFTNQFAFVQNGNPIAHFFNV
jgi:hypothetical protein